MKLKIKRVDLKPVGAVEKYNVLLQKDIDNLKLHEKNMDDVSCPVCNSRESNLVGEKYNFKLVSCSSCSFTFINPRPSPDSMEFYYANSKASAFFQTNIIGPTEHVRIEKIVKPRLNYLNDTFPNKGKWLDIGCSTATLLSEGIKSGWDGVGLDFEQTAIDQATKKGVPMLIKPIEVIKPKNEYDLITMFEVLEHLSNPKENLEACYNANKIGGSIVITVPNIDGFEFETLGMVHTNICPPSHLNHFSPSTLPKLLSDIGYAITEVETPGYLDVDNVRNAFLHNKISTTGNKFLDKIISSENESSEESREALQEIIFKSNNSGHLRVVATKKA